MNERIKELVDQCWEEDGVGPAYLNPEKFAELIVQECAKIAELKEQGYPDYDRDISVGWYMAEKFGVKR